MGMMKPVGLYLGRMLRAKRIRYSDFDRYLKKKKKGIYLFNEEEPDEGRRLSRFVDRETRITTLETEKKAMRSGLRIVINKLILTWHQQQFHQVYHPH